MWIVIYAISAFAVVRFGLIVLASASFAANILLNVPYTLDFSAWYAPNIAGVILCFAGLAAWGCYTSLAGQKVLKGELFE